MVCCVAFPHFVGRVHAGSSELPVHDPTSRIDAAQSPSGTLSYVEINAPTPTVTGSMVLNVVNRKDRPMYDVRVRYILRHPIVVDPHMLNHRITVTPTEVDTVFGVAEPHTDEYRALDFRYPNASRKVPGIKSSSSVWP